MANKKKSKGTADVAETRDPVFEDTAQVEDAVFVDVDGDHDVTHPDAEIVPDDSAIEDIVTSEGRDLAEDVIEEDVTEDTAAPIAAIAETPKKSGVLPLILGGVLAAVIGFFASRSDVIDTFLPPAWRMNASEIALQDQIDALNTQVTDVSAELANLPEPVVPEPTAPSSSNGDMQAALKEIAALNGQIEELAVRLEAIENRPIASPDVLPDFGEDFEKLRDVAEKQQAEIDALLADARLAEQTSLDAASNTLARAAATRMVAAIESGAPFAAALADLEANGTSEIPEPLRAAATDGVITLAALQEAIPDAARAALAASPAGSDGGGVGEFLKRQLGARSVAPRDGDDPDAVLSRVEGAVRQGRLTDALAEAETLPPQVKAAMSGWLENAASRLAVTSASEALMQRLETN